MDRALAALRAGAVVAAATESFFGLLADATRADAIDQLFSLKPRDMGRGVPILLPGLAAWEELVASVPPLARRLADAFWPGALTLALPAATHVDARLTVEGAIAVRLAGPSPAAQLARVFGRPLTATSANLPGGPPATSALEVAAAFAGLATDRLLIMDGSSPGGAPSTVVVVGTRGYRIVREGRISARRVGEAAGLDPEQGKG